MIPSGRMETDSLEFRQSFEVFSFDNRYVKSADSRDEDLAFDRELGAVSSLKVDDVALIGFIPNCADEARIQRGLGL